jgi:pimeloyl-ACP methyl ester carboxylesterase
MRTAPEPDGPPVPPPTWFGHPVREARWQLELAQLLADPVWRGHGVPRGDGEPVLLVPGFLHGDVALNVLNRWLRRLGYRTYRAAIRWNVDCSERAMQRLERRLDDVAARSGRPVTIIGHSRGGLFGRALVRRRPTAIARVITMGSPLADQLDCALFLSAYVAGARAVHWAVRPEARRTGCFTRDCRCPYTSDLVAPLPTAVPVTSIYSRDDGIVRPATCTPPDTEHIEVGGTHLGLAVNAEVYRHLGALLARPTAP